MAGSRLHAAPLFVPAGGARPGVAAQQLSRRSSCACPAAWRPARHLLAVRHRRRSVVVAVEQNVIIGVLTAVAGVAGGVGLLVWTENQGKRGKERGSRQPCVECRGEKEVTCRICGGSGLDPVFKAEKETCGYCEGRGKLQCTNCNGSGIQPRYLDRLSPDDFMD